jgi:hypothetical protein
MIRSSDSPALLGVDDGDGSAVSAGEPAAVDDDVSEHAVAVSAATIAAPTTRDVIRIEASMARNV